jgi:hypothetical protein
MANPETTAASGRKRLSKGMLIRLCIYVPLLSFFGWRAVDRAIEERKAADAAFRTDVGIWLESPPGIVDLSNAIPVHGEAVLSAPPGEETGTDTGTETGTGTTGTTGDTGDTDTTEGTGETGGTTSDTGTSTGAPEPDPADGTGAPPPP